MPGAGAAAAYGAGLAVLFLILVTPLDALAHQLFWVHMVQHLALLLIAAPLLVVGRPAVVCLWAFGRRGRKRIARGWLALGLGRLIAALMHPIFVWLLFCGGFAFWHFPGPYQWALRNEAVHTIEHVSFLISALMFWSIVIEPSGRRRIDYGPTLVFVMTAAILSGLPGALIALAPRPLYPVHAAGDAAWGLTLLQDQQLAGIVMWVPGGAIFLAAALLVFRKWLEPGGQVLPRRAALPALLLCCALPFLSGCEKHGQSAASSIGDARRGVALVRSYGCGGCHTVPGIADANGVVGPPLTLIGRRVYLAGVLRNTPDNMVAWLRSPQSIVRGNVMPDMGLSDRDAHDIAAYLYTLK